MCFKYLSSQYGSSFVLNKLLVCVLHWISTLLNTSPSVWDGHYKAFGLSLARVLQKASRYWLTWLVLFGDTSCLLFFCGELHLNSSALPCLLTNQLQKVVVEIFAHRWMGTGVSDPYLTSICTWFQGLSLKHPACLSGSHTAKMHVWRGCFT